MVWVIDKKTSKQEFTKILGRAKKKKSFPAKKFMGKIKLNEDALAIQKRLRAEWE